MQQLMVTPKEYQEIRDKQAAMVRQFPHGERTDASDFIAWMTKRFGLVAHGAYVLVVQAERVLSPPTKQENENEKG